jgi:hypothetical protein
VVAAASTAAATPAPTEEISIDPATPRVTSTPRLAGTPPAGGGTITVDETPVAVGTQPAINPPSTLEDLLKQYPDLKPFIDKLPPNLSEADLSELYKKVVQIYKDKGASGVATFLKDSGILDKLGIPLSYIDLITAFGDKGDLKAVEKLARSRGLINKKDEIIGYLVLDAKDSLQPVTNECKNLGVSVYRFDENLEEVEIGVPLSILSQYQTPGALLGYLIKIAKIPHVVGFRPPTPLTNSGPVNLQQFNTKGAATIGADKWHAAGITGKGVKVGILDSGFGSILKYAGKQLPAANKMKSNIPLDELDGSEEVHGTAVAMVIHGVAPDAELFIAHVDFSSGDSWVSAIEFLIDNKVQIINLSAGTSVGPRDGTFGMAVAVDAIVEETGILWVNAAGNEGSSHSMFQYNDNGKGVHAFSDKIAALPFVPLAPVTTVVMNWNGNWAGKEKDEYDFAIVDKDGNEVVVAAEAKKGKKGDLPFQAATFESNPKEMYFMVVHKEKGEDDKIMDIFIPNAVFPDWAQVPDHSIGVPADAKSAFAVGATGLTKDVLEKYSSQGPTNDDRVKPDITAPTGEGLPVYPKGGFTGTSGAAPLAAGAAALVWQKFPDMKYDEVKAFLRGNVKDLGDKGEDNQFGAGRIALPVPDDVDPENPSNPDSTPVPDDKGPVATINNVDTQFNVKVKGQKGIAIAISFEIDNFKGKKGLAAVLFFNKDGSPVTPGDNKYKIGPTIGTAAFFTPKSDKAAYDDAVLFIPNSAFSKLGSGTKELYYIVAILDSENLEKPLAESDKVPVKFKK